MKDNAFCCAVRVLLLNSWFYLSVVLSREEVASSNIIRLGFLDRHWYLSSWHHIVNLMSVLAMATLCLSPPDSFTPRSPTIVSYCKNRRISWQGFPNPWSKPNLPGTYMHFPTCCCWGQSMPSLEKHQCTPELKYTCTPTTLNPCRLTYYSLHRVMDCDSLMERKDNRQEGK